MSRPSPGPRFRAALFLTAGAMPFLFAFPVYSLAVQMYKQIALPRLLGWLEVAALVGLALAAVASAVVSAVPARAGLARAGRALLFGGVAASVLLTGLAVYFNHPRLAPSAWQLGAALAWLGLAAAFWRKRPDEQALTLRALAIAGVGVLSALALAAPYVVASAWSDRPRNPHALTPPASPAVKASAPKRIVLITFDELRARTTSLVDPALDATPELAELAKEATWFAGCHSAGDQTILSMPTVLSGLRPPAVFARDRNMMNAIRHGSISGVADFLRAAGYHTSFSGMVAAARTFGMQAEYDDIFQTTTFIDSPFNGPEFVPLRQAIDDLTPERFKKPTRVSKLPPDVHPIHSVVEQSLEMYRSAPEHSFLWVHIGVPHHPYYNIPPAEHRKLIRRADYPQIHRFQHRKIKDPAFYTAVYNAYAHFGDAQFGLLMEGLRASPQWKDTLLIVTADHGTRMDAPGKRSYAAGEVDEDITHVPLLVHAPGQTRPARVDAAVGHEDIVPTILSAVYPAVPDGFKGGSLLADLAPDRIGYTWTFGKGERAAYQGRFKLVVQGDKPPRLTDWTTDAAGRHELSAAQPERARALRDWLDRELPSDAQ